MSQPSMWKASPVENGIAPLISTAIA